MMSITRLVSGFFLTIAIWIVGVVVYRLTVHPLARYPGPILARITGFYSVYHAYVGDLHLDMLRCHEEYGKFVRYGPNKLIISTNNAIQDIYSRNANVKKSTAYRAFQTTPTAHDLQSTVDKVAHARKRRVMSQAFSDSAIKSLEASILQHVRAFVRCLSEDCQKSDDLHGNSKAQIWNMTNWCNYLSFDLMAELVFGRSFGMLEKPDNRFIIDLIQYVAFRVGVCLHMPLLAVWNVDKVISPNVRSLRDRYVSLSKRLAMQRASMETKRADLFSYILAAKDPETGLGFSLDELWGEATLLIVAGSDAISTAMAGCFFYLSRNQTAYEKARDEVRSIFDTDEDIRMGSKLSSCMYLRACIEESLRMSPPVGGALWREVCPGGLHIEGHVIPQGIDVGVGIYALQHNPAYFEAPFDYLPDRWIVDGKTTQEDVALRRSAFTAFSTGPGGCLGKNLSYMELTLTVAHVMWALDMENSKDSKSSSSQATYLRSYKAHAEHEFHLRDRFTSWKDGPLLKFAKRRDQAQETVTDYKLRS